MQKIIIIWLLLTISIHSYTIRIIQDNLKYPWSLAILPSHELLITEKPGRIIKINQKNGDKKAIRGIPTVVFKGQGGLLDIVLHPDFKKNKWIYLSYSAKQNKKNVLKVTRYILKKDRLLNPKNIFTTKPARKSSLHFGGRLLFLPDKTLLISHGDGYKFMNEAQLLNNHFGKVLRVNDDGTIPKNNPWTKNKNAYPEIWSIGHRNIQGMTINSQTNELYTHEHGPKGGDELNITKKGKNYGWPRITYGKNYDGTIISPFTKMKGLEQPIKYWIPSIALSSMIYYDRSLFPKWKNSFMITGLRSKNVHRIKIQNKKVIEHEILFEEINERLRDIKVDSDDGILILTDGPKAKLIKIQKK